MQRIKYIKEIKNKNLFRKGFNFLDRQIFLINAKGVHSMLPIGLTLFGKLFKTKKKL